VSGSDSTEMRSECFVRRLLRDVPDPDCWLWRERVDAVLWERVDAVVWERVDAVVWERVDAVVRETVDAVVSV